MRDKIKSAVKDSARKLLYYDRKNDEDLPFGEIELAIKRGEVSVDEITKWFREELIDYMNA